MKKKIVLSLFVCSSLFADAQIDELRKQIQQQKLITQQLEKKLDELSKKYEHSEKKLQVLSQKQQSHSVNNSASFSQNAYLPDIALILNMSAVSRDVKNSDYANMTTPNLIEKGEMNLPFNKNRGFNINYAEVAMHSVVDPYFEAFANFHLHPNEFEIGEAYVQTTSLPYSLKVKAGKFKSAFGRINSKHQHSWNFDEQPIIYKALFTPDGISDAGVQLQYIFPTDIYLMAGMEAMQGNSDRSFGDEESNNLYVGYLKLSVDIGEDTSILGGVSLAHGKNTTGNNTDIYGVDLTIREQLGSYSSLMWQSEFLQRDKNDGIKTDQQSGFYSEVVYHYDKNYAGGIRYEGILQNPTKNLDKYSAMVEYKPFPMSRLRLSYSCDKTKYMADEQKNVNSIIMSLNIATGAHGAHDY